LACLEGWLLGAEVGGYLAKRLSLKGLCACKLSLTCGLLAFGGKVAQIVGVEARRRGRLIL
jgi:hypothetical protein